MELDIELRNFEAERGTRRVVRYEVAVRCASCQGHGMIGTPDPDCEFCGGTGFERTRSDLEHARLLQFEPCPVCLAEPCLKCEGTGLVSERQRLRLLVPPGIDDGTWLRVRGGGAEVAGDSIPGDLLVHVKVLPPPRDPRIVRYAALLLLLVAIAALVVYLLH
jgi:molecular chaperone DnaJ